MTSFGDGARWAKRSCQPLSRFHGVLTTPMPLKSNVPAKGKISFCTEWTTQSFQDDQTLAFWKEMRDAKANGDFVAYGTRSTPTHSLMPKDAPPPAAYNERPSTLLDRDAKFIKEFCVKDKRPRWRPLAQPRIAEITFRNTEPLDESPSSARDPHFVCSVSRTISFVREQTSDINVSSCIRALLFHHWQSQKSKHSLEHLLKYCRILQFPRPPVQY